jgi:hypothetical protein
VMATTLAGERSGWRSVSVSNRFKQGVRFAGCSRWCCRGCLAASQSSLVHIRYLPRALLRLGIVPVLATALGRVLFPGLIRERALVQRVLAHRRIPRRSREAIPQLGSSDPRAWSTA